MNAITTSQYANHIGYSDVTPYEIIAISKSGKKITIRAMAAERDLEWKPEWNIGGFVANCSNQNDQNWKIEPDENGLVLEARLRKDGCFHSPMGRHKIADAPRRFYDFNF